MSLVAIIPVANLLSANNALELAGFGANNFSVACYGATGATHAAMHSWPDAAFYTAVKALPAVIWEESDGDPKSRTKVLIEAQGAKWGNDAPQLPSTGNITAGDLYRDGDLLWYVIQSFNRTTFNAPPATYPALIRAFRNPTQVYPWKQPIDQYDSYALLNPFTGEADKCTHNGKVWASTVNTNVWEPSVFGWVEVL